MQDNGSELGTELALLTDGMFFGERALIKQQTRYALYAQLSSTREREKAPDCLVRVIGLGEG